MPKVEFFQNTLGHWLRQARLEVGYSLRDLAKESGVSASQILRIENNDYGVSLDTFVQICAALGVPAGLLIEDCVSDPFDKYAEAVGRSQELKLFLEKSGLKTPTNLRSAQEFIGCTCAVLAHMLLSSNPSRFAKVISYPFPEMRDGFIRFGESIDQAFTSSERLSWLLSLRRNGFAALKQLGLMSEQLVVKYVKEQPNKGGLWTPDTNGSALRTIEERPEKPFLSKRLSVAE